jgi:hypothetical protein
MSQEKVLVGKTAADRERNAALLGGYDYETYPEALTGYTGQDLQRIGFVRWAEAVRTRVGPPGNYKAGLAQLPNGKLVIAACRDNRETGVEKRRFFIHVYESADQGLTWAEIGETELHGKEPSLTACADGSLVLTAQGFYLPPGCPPGAVPVSRSLDGGRVWRTVMMHGPDYPRNLIAEADGSLLLVRAMRPDWLNSAGGSPNLEIGRSPDGLSWDFSEGRIDWNWGSFGEVAAIRLRSGRLLAALRRQVPGTRHEGYEDTVFTESLDGGRTWAKPWPLGRNAEVHAYLTELRDGRLLCTYSNYHLPWGVFAISSSDGGATWELDNPIQLALSADIYVGWAVTLQLADGSLITSYAATTYYNQPAQRTTSEVVRWRLP